MEWFTEAGWVLAYQLIATQQRQRITQAMARFSFGVRPYPVYLKPTRPLDIF